MPNCFCANDKNPDRFGLDSTNKWIIGLVITAIIGIVGIGVTVILFFCQITTTYF